MSRKTKKEKILAEYHRKLQALQLPKYNLPEKAPVEKYVPKLSPTEPKTDYSYVLSDLKRILFLTALAICAQVVLWYAIARR